MPVEFTASTYTYLWKADLRTALADIAGAGYAGAELMVAPPHVELWREIAPAVEALGAACKAAGTRINSVVPAGLDVNLASPDAAMREWSLEQYLTVGRLAAQLNAGYLVIHPGRRHPFKPAPYDTARDWIVEALSKIARAMADEGVRPLFENTPSTILDTAEECTEVVNAVGADRLGICYDVANGFMVEEPTHGLRTVAEFLELVHLSDTTTGKWLHDPIGAGEVGFAAVAATIEEIGYDGPVVAETIHQSHVAEGLRRDRLALLDTGWKGRESPVNA